MAKQERPTDATDPETVADVMTDPAQAATDAATTVPERVEPATEMTAAKPQAIESRPSGFFPAILGGGLAAALGFGLSHFNAFGLNAPAPDLSGVKAQLSAVEDGLAKTRQDLDALKAVPPTTDPAVLDRLGALEATPRTASQDPRLDALVARMDALDQQLAKASAEGTGISGAALAALQADVQALKSATPAGGPDLAALANDAEARLAEAEAKAKALTVEAEAIAAKGQATAALGQLRAALDTGLPYKAALASLPAADIPKTVSDYADSGLPTLASLQSSFPDSARAALEAALRANMGESWTDRVGTFLRSQTGARSLTPREGSDPDAILSRAEAALAKADLDAALNELAALPEPAMAAMSDWVGQAERRRDAAKAIDALAAKIEG